MKIHVIGKAYFQGTSKNTGAPYNFIQVHYNCPDRGVIGTAALTANLDPSLVKFDSISIPGDYILEFDNRGYPVEFAPASNK